MTNILITGGSRGIGYELVKQFAQHTDNYIVVLSRNTDKLKTLQAECLKLYNNNITIYGVDFDSPSLSNDLQHIVKQEAKHFHILVNNAGVLINQPFSETSLHDFIHIYKVNVFAPALLIKEVLQNNQPEQSTHVVNISSMGGFQGSAKFPGLSVYSSSKAAIGNLTEVLAEEYKASNTKFNCLALGAAQTEMLNEAFPDYKAPLSAVQIAIYIHQFCITGANYFNGKIIPVALTKP
ncbi:MAG: SDR family NAD(P)-dependent oxidoreductase [Flavobacteriales bacterium]